jgi:hypothetical protein
LIPLTILVGVKNFFKSKLINNGFATFTGATLVEFAVSVDSKDGNAVF